MESLLKLELDRELCETFPKIFKDRYSSPKKTAMCWGFECGDGWKDILYELCHMIQSHIDFNSRPNKPIPQVVATQVKEKFGTLRFYYSGGDSVIDGMVDMAEAWSAHTCEVCGEVGKIRDKGWIMVRCDKHV